MNYKFIPVLFALVALAGCKKITDPDGATLTTRDVVKTSRDIDNLLYGAYSAIANDLTGTGLWRVFPELLADAVDLNVVEDNSADPYGHLYQRNMLSSQYAQSWALSYTGIQNANLIIYAVDNQLVTQATDPEFNNATRDRVRGEALFIRALTYFELVRLYGHQYGHRSSVAGSGVVLRLQPTLNITKPDDITGAGRSTVEEVYTSIISDLKAAEVLLPPSVERRGRAYAACASAILARVYFQMGDYTNARLQINKVIGNVPGIMTRFGLTRAKPFPAALTAAEAASDALNPFNTSLASGAISPETIFDFIGTTNSPVSNLISRKYRYLENLVNPAAAVNPHLAINNKYLLDSVRFATTVATPADPVPVPAARVDGRYTLITLGAGTKYYTKKYDRALMNVPVIRAAELLLDRAEINAMAATTSIQAHADAIADLNLIRDRVQANYVPATTATLNAANVLSEVRRERLRELLLEGDRLHDLRRRRATVGFGIRALPWNSNKLLLKIPETEIQSSPNVVQNPD